MIIIIITIIIITIIVFIFSENISMEFGLKKCGVVILKKGKLVKFDEIHLPNQEIMKE